MKRTLLVLAIAALLPKICSSGVYSRQITPDSVVENRAGVITSTARTSLSKRIEGFAVKHGADPDLAPELAELLAVCEYPRVLTAIASKESRFNPDAIGSAGEIGAWQVREKFWGHPGETLAEQAKASEAILRDLVDASGGQLKPAIRRYNGSGKQAERYAEHVLKMALEI